MEKISFCGVKKKNWRQKNSEQSNRDVTELARGGVGVARHRNVGKVGRVALRQPEVWSEIPPPLFLSLQCRQSHTRYRARKKKKKKDPLSSAASGWVKVSQFISLCISWIYLCLFSWMCDVRRLNQNHSAASHLYGPAVAQRANVPTCHAHVSTGSTQEIKSAIMLEPC